ncbi:MAG: hypothetical protein HYX37_13210 [Rhizobiales bacterium]|nr:hypothetical protein [Hyphomicrobiales bacterium]
MAPYVRPYISPKERAENRARWIRIGYWTAVTIPAAIALMMFGYSDQAPAWLREITVKLDALFGFPVLGLIKAIAA